jgi:hypothetical protein
MRIVSPDDMPTSRVTSRITVEETTMSTSGLNPIFRGPMNVS